MSKKVVSIGDALREALLEKSEEAAKEIIDNAVSSELLPYQTTQLNRVLCMAGSVQFSHFGPAEEVDKSKVLNAARSQHYQFSYIAHQNRFSLTFDGEYTYVLSMLNSFTQAQGNEAIASLEGEARANAFISIENRKRMLGSFDPGSKPDPRTFLERPLNTRTLSVLINHSESVERPMFDDLGKVTFDALSESEVADLILDKAKYHLFNAGLDRKSKVISIYMSDDNAMYTLSMPKKTDGDMLKMMFGMLEQDIVHNHTRSRESNPALAEIRSRMKEADTILKDMMDANPEVKEHIKNTLENDVEYQRAQGNHEKADELIAIKNADNVTGLSSRRR